MLNEIEKINGKIIDYIYYPKIDEYKIIEHYKYHNQEMRKIFMDIIHACLQ